MLKDKSKPSHTLNLLNHSIPEKDNFNNQKYIELDIKKAPLVEYAKSSAPRDLQTSENTTFFSPVLVEFSHRTARYYAQNLAANLLFAKSAEVIDKNNIEERKKYHRIITCLRAPTGKNIKIHKSVEHGKTFYSGLCTCGNVWVCPVCAAKIQSRRTIEVQDLFQWSYKKQGKQIAMVTLTYPHALGDILAESLEKHAKALEIFRAYNNKSTGTGYKKFKTDVGYVGLVRSLEITYGQNGWHPHTHELWIIDDFEPNAEKEDNIKQYILNRWEHACKKAGLLTEDKIKDFREHSTDIVFRAKDSDYIAKQNKDIEDVWASWGADKEIACATSKTGKSNGKAPFQLLLETEKKPRYKAIFLDYALAMKGKAQLFWTHGLKGKVGLEEMTDEEIAEQTHDRADLLALLEKDHWKIVVLNKARGEILDIAEKNGLEGLQKWFADYGLKLDKPTEQDLEDDRLAIKKRIADKTERLAKRAKRKGLFKAIK